MSATVTVRAYGIGLNLPTGWDGVVYRRAATAGAATFPVAHSASFALPTQRGDFGGGAVELMRPGDALVCLIEYQPESVDTALFGNVGLPRPLKSSDMSPRTLQRAIAGQAGAQRFFAFNGRALCLYVVLGSYLHWATSLPSVNQVIAGLEIGPSGEDGSG